MVRYFDLAIVLYFRIYKCSDFSTIFNRIVIGMT